MALGQTQPSIPPANAAFVNADSVSPALANFTRVTVLGDLWRRPGLSRRDRSIVTLTVLIARGQTIELPYYVNLALDNGITPLEISEMVTHLAFYTGWDSAMSAVPSIDAVFKQRAIAPSQLAQVNVDLLPVDQPQERERATTVANAFGKVAPGVEQFTTNTLFDDLWRRPGLRPRDRSLVTISALVATGQTAQLSGHLLRALHNGLTPAEASEAMTQLAFYAGWPNVFSALPILKEVLSQQVNAH